jgi:2-polyprenyl-3-methyl-5-hydroxy-6-metoxy-1,4-benzoquinol methylase
MEFDYQWANLPCPQIEFSHDRVLEFLAFTNIPKQWFAGKHCLDAGCGNGRYTYALQQLGADVDSFDISEEAVKICGTINPNCWVGSILDLDDWVTGKYYDFILCWGVLHHLKDPKAGFDVLKRQVKKGGILHIMVYHTETEKFYYGLRRLFHCLKQENKLELCRVLATYTGSVHGWYDAMNPEYNHSFTPDQIKKWFDGFSNIRVITEVNININAVR